MLTKNVDYPRQKIIVCLFIIILISLSLKLYTTDFSVPETGDSWTYILRAIANSNGFYAEVLDKSQGWNLLISPFFFLTDSEQYIDYVNITRILSITLSLANIPIIYCLGRKFFSEKFSLVMASLFAFQPHINFNSGIGFSEPLFILIFSSALYLLINDKLDKKVFFAFFLVGLLFWARFSGILLIPVFIIAFLIYYRNSKNFIFYFLLCMLILLIVFAPMLSLRAIEFGNPIYFENSDVSVLSGDISIQDVFQQGLKNSIYVLGVTLVPYLIILIPIGVGFSFINSKNKKKPFITIIILILLSFIPLIPVYYSMSASRMLFHIYPLVIILATFGIQKINETMYEKLKIKRKNLIVITIVGMVLISSVLVTHGIEEYGYGRPNIQKINEILDYSHFLTHNLDGNLFWSKGVDPDWVKVNMLNESNGAFVKYDKYPTDVTFLYFDDFKEFNPGKLYVLHERQLKADSLQELLIKGQKLNLKFISVGKNNDENFLNQVYHEEENFPYLIKIFDSKDFGFKEYYVKTFEIDYKLFNSLNNNKIIP